MTYSNDSVDAQIASAIARLRMVDASISEAVASNIQQIRANAVPIQGYDWGFSNDVNFYPIPDGCELRTVVHYWAEDMIEYRSDLYEKLSPTDQAGLWVHEGIFKLYRDFSKDSLTLSTRRIVALLFAQETPMNLLKQMVYKNLKDQKNTAIVQLPAAQLASKNMQITGKFCNNENTLFFYGYLYEYATYVKTSNHCTQQTTTTLKFELEAGTYIPYAFRIHFPSAGIHQIDYDISIQDQSGKKYPVSGKTFTYEQDGTPFNILIVTDQLRNFELGK
jgi:hypothetical protein